MKPLQPWLAAVFAAALVALVGAAWITLAPAQFGGQASYVIVSGNSMEPVFQMGDLVILRETGDYGVGDIVTYRHPTIGPVIHRIIARENGHFVLQGDHNSWIDSYRPAPADVIGEFWIHLPYAGKIVERLRAPGSVAVLAAAVTALGMTARGDGREKRRHPAQRPRNTDLVMKHFDRNKADLLFVAAAAGFVSLLLGAVAFTRPITRTVSEEINYQQTGEFGYYAAAPAGVYDADIARTGQPVFRSLTDLVVATFDYRLVSDQPGELSGTYRLVLEVGDINGWKRTIELQPETPFTGNGIAIRGVIDLSQVQSVIDNAVEQTGVERQYYTLTLRPEVSVAGSLAGQAIQDHFSPQLVFQLDPLELYLSRVGLGDTDPLRPSRSGLLLRTRLLPNTFSLLSVELSILTARVFSTMGLALSLAAVAALARQLKTMSQGDETTWIQARHGALLVAVENALPEAIGNVVRVATIDDLAQIAQKDGRLILHAAQGAGHHYYVKDVDVTYLYRSANGHRPMPASQGDTA